MSVDFKKFSGSGMTSDSSRLKLISELKKQGIKNNKVLNAMSIVPRHIFVDEAIAGKAYDNTAYKCFRKIKFISIFFFIIKISH